MSNEAIEINGPEIIAKANETDEKLIDAFQRQVIALTQYYQWTYANRSNEGAERFSRIIDMAKKGS